MVRPLGCIREKGPSAPAVFDKEGDLVEMKMWPREFLFTFAGASEQRVKGDVSPALVQEKMADLVKFCWPLSLGGFWLLLCAFFS